MSIENGVLTHELRHIETGKSICQGNKKECEIHLRSSYHADGHKNFEIAEIPFSGAIPLVEKEAIPLPADISAEDKEKAKADAAAKKAAEKAETQAKKDAEKAEKERLKAEADAKKAAEKAEAQAKKDAEKAEKERLKAEADAKKAAEKAEASKTKK